MNDILRFVLIIAGLLLVFYFINGSTAKVVPNAGSVTMNQVAPQMLMPIPAGAPKDDDPFDEPVPGNPESAIGSSVDKLNWDGLGENQLQGALNKQYQDLTGEDLLPHNDIANFAEVYPNGVGQLQNKNYLNSGHHVGINTIGQALKNANHQLRSEPPNPQMMVSPWNQSSYGPDLTRRPLQIGDCD